jgi:hypothetical protein
MNFILKYFSRESLWEAIMDKEGFGTVQQAENYNVWTNVFRRSPELVDYLKRREITLLKASTLGKSSKDFLLGQIAENRLWQAYDVPFGEPIKVDVPKKVKHIDKASFLSKWKDGNKNKASETEVSK